jgi:hypothetical protein
VALCRLPPGGWWLHRNEAPDDIEDEQPQLRRRPDAQGNDHVRFRAAHVDPGMRGAAVDAAEREVTLTDVFGFRNADQRGYPPQTGQSDRILGLDRRAHGRQLLSMHCDQVLRM